MAGKKRGPEDNRRLAKALGHDLRLRILRLLIAKSEPVSPKEASNELSEVLSNVSYHFRVLAEHQALKLRRKRAVRGSTEHFYSPNPRVVEMPMVQQILSATAND